MRRVRVIPTLLIKRGGLTKSIKFKDHKYVGDPINAVKIFNEKEVDEIVVIDISSTQDGRPLDFAKISEFTDEAFMPLAYGGGITKLDEIKALITLGVEKVIINTSAFENPQLIRDAAQYFGSQSIMVSMDVKRNIWGKYKVYVKNGTKSTGIDPVEYARKMESQGAGELIVNAIDKDGTFEGYDLELIHLISKEVSIPLVAIGGAATIADFKMAIDSGASAVAAGSMFVYQRPHRAVLISYPSQKELIEQLFAKLI